MSETQVDRTLVHQCLADGAEGVEQLIADVMVLASHFRRGDIERAGHGLAQLARDLKALVVLVQGLADPVSILEPALALPSTPDVERLIGLLESIVAAQVSHDWLTVADLLEYELEPELRIWLGSFETVKQGCAA